MSSTNPKDDGSFKEEIERADKILKDLEGDRYASDDEIENFASDFPLNSDISGEERELLDEIGRSEQKLDDLDLELREAEAAIDALREKNEQYQALIRVCTALDDLDALGARNLFWGDTYDHDKQASQMVRVRQRIDAHDREIEKAEQRRQDVLDRIEDQNLELDSLDTYLRDAMEKEERRRAEWIVENDPRELAYREIVMPWARGEDEDRRFRLAILVTILVSLTLGVLLPMIDLPIPLREQLTEVPERVANVIREELPEPEPAPPPPVEEQLAEEEPIEPEVAEELVEELVEVPVEPTVAEVEQPDPAQQVRSKGILAFRDSFAQNALDRPNTSLGSQARVRSAGEDSVGRPERAMVTSNAPGSSGGINLANISRDVGGGGSGIEGVALTQVASSIGTGDGPDRPLAAGMSAGRTDEEIQIVFDRYKAALYRLYNRELRKDPTLRGQLVLRLTIEPDGSVSFCEVQSSDMDAPALSEQVVARVRTFDFGAKEDIVAVTIVYPIDFLPAG